MLRYLTTTFLQSSEYRNCCQSEVSNEALRSMPCRSLWHSAYSSPPHYKKMRGQFHSSDTLTPRNVSHPPTPICIEYEAGWAPVNVLTLWGRNRNWFCLELILLSSIVTLLTELSCFRFVQVTHVCIPAIYEARSQFSVIPFTHFIHSFIFLVFSLSCFVSYCLNLILSWFFFNSSLTISFFVLHFLYPLFFPVFRSFLLLLSPLLSVLHLPSLQSILPCFS